MNKIIIVLTSLIILVTSMENKEVINNIVVFGDSYSDVGQPLTNGPLWSEHLAVGWNASLYSFAFNGAVCNNDMYSEGEFIPSIVDQIEMYYKQNLTLDIQETVVIFWIGINDVYKIFKEYPNQIELKSKQVVDCISENIRNIRRIFSTNKFIVFGVPPLERMPYYANSNLTEIKEKTANDLNQKLTKEVEKMNKNFQHLELDLLDIHRLLDDISEKPNLFNIQNTKDAYWDICQGNCNEDIDSFVWWDKTHLTGRIHRLIANSILMAGSLAPETYLDDNLDVKQLLSNQSNFIYRSPKFNPTKNTGEIQKLIHSLNEQKEKEIDQNQQEYQDISYSTFQYHIRHTTYVFYGISLSLTISILFLLCVKRRRRSHLGALTNLLKSNRGKFTPVRNIDVEP